MATPVTAPLVTMVTSVSLRSWSVAPILVRMEGAVQILSMAIPVLAYQVQYKLRTAQIVHSTTMHSNSSRILQSNTSLLNDMSCKLFTKHQVYSTQMLDDPAKRDGHIFRLQYEVLTLLLFASGINIV